ncbi:MAG: hypothetical protein HKP13_11250 [Gammaproteobacteria bacterium]|nr:hypothetical protein [Gammaproteobacteria bacterium]
MSDGWKRNSSILRVIVTGIQLALHLESIDLIVALQNADLFIQILGTLKFTATLLAKIATDLRMLSGGDSGMELPAGLARNVQPATGNIFTFVSTNDYT